MTYKPVDTAIVMVVGPCIDDTDFKSLEEAIAYDAGGMDVSLIVEKTDGTTAVTAITLTTGGTSDWTHKDGGYYEIEVTAAQNAEEGIAYVRGVCTGVLPFESIHYNVVKANIYDSLIKGTDVLKTDVTQWLGTAVTANIAGQPTVDITRIGASTQSLIDLKDFVDSGYDPATNKVQGVVLVDTTTTNTDLVSAAAVVNEWETQSQADPTGFHVNVKEVNGTAQTANDNSADINAILIDTDELQTDWVNGGRLDLLLDAIPTTAMRGTDNAALAATALLNTTWTDAKAAFLDHSIATVDTNLDTLLTRITAARAGYLDNLSAGAVALAATALTDVTWTDAKAVFLDHSIATVDTVADGIQTDLDNATDGLGALKALIDTVDGIVDNILLDTGTDGVLLAATATSAQLVGDAWDEILSGATHNIVGSAGRRVREIGAFAIESGTAQAGTSQNITLAATASAIDGTYNRNLVVLTDNTGVGQTRTIVDYDGTTKVAVIDRDWRTTPDATTSYQVTADNTPLVVDQGVARAGTSTTITLRTYASSSNDIYLCNVVAIIAGTGRGQARLIGAYNGTSKVATICGDNWITNPDTTSVYVLMPYGTTCTSCIGTYALGLINTECDTALTDYDPPTRTEATTDKDAIITEVNANETKIDALNDITVADIIASIADGSYDLQEMMRIMFAALSGKSSGGGTTTLTFRDSGDAKNRITAIVNSSGDRTAMTLDAT